MICRLLAHAGFDARDAVSFWENRDEESDCSASRSSRMEQLEGINGLARSIMGSTHPVNEVRIESLKRELQRWEEAKLAALASVREEEPSSSPEITSP